MGNEAAWMRGLRWVAVFGAVVMLLGSAAPAEKDKFAYSTIGNSCAPWDGPAIDLHVSTTPLKCGEGDVIELTVSFWRELPLHEDQTFSLDKNSRWGGAYYCKSGEQPCERATTGSIHIEKYTEGKGATGTYELLFPKLGRVTGTFHSNWCKMRGRCG